jgi:hypothetical protein
MREAVLALMETADAARSFEDLYERAGVQADAADALWPFDEQAARSILRRAWDVTTAPGVVPAFRREGEREEETIETVVRARRAVIEVAFKHDARTGDVYMKALMQGFALSEDTWRVASGEGESQSTSEVRRRMSLENDQRLVTAYGLIEEGAYESAAVAAAPALSGGVSGQLVSFIIALRAHAPREGDALYVRLLERTRADSWADANDVLLLSQPIVSPDLQVLINPDGSAHMRPANYSDEAMRRAFNGAPPEVRLAFYATAAAVLLRPPRQTEDEANAKAETAALYFTTGRLLPFFEREAAQYAPALQARMAALSAEIDAGRAQSLSANMKTLSLTPENPVDPIADTLEELSREKDSGRRDRVRLRAVMTAARRALWNRARTIAAEVEDAQAQREAQRVIAIYQVMNDGRAYDDEPDGHERAAEFARAAEVPPEFRAAGLAQAAELAARAGKRARAEALFEEALLFANQAEKPGARSLTALAFVAQAAARVNAARTWDVLPALVARANETEDLSNVRLQFEVNYPSYAEADGGPVSSVPDDALSLEDAFEAAARTNFRRALKDARTFEDGPTRASVTIAVARVALEKGGKVGGDKAR